MAASASTGRPQSSSTPSRVIEGVEQDAERLIAARRRVVFDGEPDGQQIALLEGRHREPARSLATHPVVSSS
jgi:hypothetical protein